MAKQGQFWSMYDALRKENNWSQVNEGRYNNPDHDKHYDQASNETDPVKSNELLVTMNDIIIDDVVLIPIVQRASEQ